MASKYRIREAIESDNLQLIELARRCPIQGHIQFYSDRFPDFFAMLRLQGEKAHIYVAEAEDGLLVACAAFIEKTVNWGGKSVKTLHFGDLRTDPRIRASRVAVQLVQIYNEILTNGEFHHGLAEFVGGSTTSLKAQKFLGKAIDLHHEGDARMVQIMPLWNYRVSKTWRYRQAREVDLEAISALLCETHAERPGAPDFSLLSLAAALRHHSSFNLTNLWIAETKDGEIVACAGLWDQATVRQVVATRFSRAAKVGIRFFAAWGLLQRLPPVPRLGKALRYQALRWPSARPENAKALQNLCRHLVNRVRAEGQHQFVTIGFHEKDDLAKVLRGMVRVEEKVKLFSHRVRSMHSQLPALPDSHQGRHFVDLTIV